MVFVCASDGRSNSAFLSCFPRLALRGGGIPLSFSSGNFSGRTLKQDTHVSNKVVRVQKSDLGPTGKVDALARVFLVPDTSYGTSPAEKAETPNSNAIFTP